jgi:acyl-ACP thioesterase
VLAPPVDDDLVELTTWSSGRAAVAASRRLSLAGDRGGRVELDSTWIHLGPDQRPARIEDFGPYSESAAGRVVSTRLELPEPHAEAAARVAWPLRATDADVLGHVNNAAYWHAVEQRLGGPAIDPSRPFRARLDHRHELDLGDVVELVEASEDGLLSLAFSVAAETRAVALVEQLA